MKAVWIVFGALLGITVGVGTWAYQQRQKIRSGGTALVQDAENKLVPSDGARSPIRVADEEWLTKFTLTERTGESVSSQELLGQPYVAGFFFSTCPSICIKQNGKVKELQELFKGKPVRFVSISVDPEIDSPATLTEYANRLGADPEQWLFLTGDMDYISRVGAEVFSLGVARRGHPEKFALVDASGKVDSFYVWTDEAQFEALKDRIEEMIAAQPSEAQPSAASSENSTDKNVSE